MLLVVHRLAHVQEVEADRLECRQKRDRQIEVAARQQELHRGWRDRRQK